MHTNLKENKYMELDLSSVTNKVIEDGLKETLLSQSKFPREVVLRFADLIEQELLNPRNQEQIKDSHQREVFAVYSSIIKLMVQFSGQEDGKIEALYTEALKVAKQIREYEDNQKTEEAKSKIIIP